MKSKDQELLEEAYTQVLLNEGIGDWMKEKASSLIKSLLTKLAKAIQSRNPELFDELSSIKDPKELANLIQRNQQVHSESVQMSTTGPSYPEPVKMYTDKQSTDTSTHSAKAEEKVESKASSIRDMIDSLTAGGGITMAVVGGVLMNIATMQHLILSAGGSAAGPFFAKAVPIMVGSVSGMATGPLLMICGMFIAVIASLKQR